MPAEVTSFLDYLVQLKSIGFSPLNLILCWVVYRVLKVNEELRAENKACNESRVQIALKKGESK